MARRPKNCAVRRETPTHTLSLSLAVNFDDHKRLTFYFNGHNMRLTDVADELIPQIAGDGKTTIG